MDWAQFNDSILQFGVGMAFFFVVLEAMRDRKQPNLGYLSAIMVLIGGMLLNMIFYLRGTWGEHLWVTYFHAPSAVLIGPLCLKLAQRLTNGGVPGNPHARWHFIFMVLAIIGSIYFATLPEVEQRAMLMQGKARFAFDLINIAGLIMLITYESYFFFIIYWLLKLRKRAEDYTHLNTLTIFVVAAACPTILTAIGFFGRNDLFFHLGGTSSVLAIAAVYLLSAVYADFFHSWMPALRKMKYQNTNLAGVDVDAVLAQIKDLIEDDHIHLDSELKLKDMAAELKINPHQLSRIINERFGQNFNEFINMHRIEEAKRMLLEEQDESVLQVAFLAGFSTKSAFNKQFRKSVGMSPTEFRKK